MIQIKKTILTLALLLTAATGARADWTGGNYTATATENLGAITVNGDATLTINSDVTVTITGGINVASGTLTVTGPGTLVVTGAKGTDGGGGFTGGNGTPGGVAISGNIVVQDGATVQANGGAGGNGGAGEPENGGHGANGGAAISGNVTVQGGATVTATGGNGGNGGNSGGETGGNGGNGGNAFAGTLTYKSGTVTANGGSGGSGGTGMGGMANGSSGSAGKAFANDVDFSQTNGYSVTNGTSPIGSVLNQTKVVISGGTDPSATTVDIDWNKAEKSGTFTMPGGNVTLEPEYYPQATVADGGVTAAEADARATTDDPLVKVDATKLTGAKKLMYFVSNSGTTAPAYDAEGWTDQLPTAEGFTQQGIVYVWYYPVGTDEGVDDATATYSDGDICLQSITARIAAAPTYAVEFAEGTPESDKWKAEPNAGVTKGQTVTVTYTGSKKVIGVKAEKKAAAPAETTVTLTPGEIGDLTSWGSSKKTINGITIEVSGDAHIFTTGLMDVTAFDPETGDPISSTGTYTFTSSVGKIKRIDINHNGGKWWGSGDGWPGSYEVWDNSTFTWSGTPAASVTLNGSGNDTDNCTFDVSSIVFTIEPTN